MKLKWIIQDLLAILVHKIILSGIKLGLSLFPKKVPPGLDKLPFALDNNLLLLLVSLLANEKQQHFF